MLIFLKIIALCYVTGLTIANQSYNYEKMHNYGIGRRIIPNFRRMLYHGYEYPSPLPTTNKPNLVRDPYPKLYQGTRRRSRDVRIFKKEFDYPATDSGHKIMCESLVNCIISHIAIETEDGIPIILRGGVGYRHFTIIVRAKAGDPLKGDIKVYCYKTPENSMRNGAEDNEN